MCIASISVSTVKAQHWKRWNWSMDNTIYYCDDATGVNILTKDFKTGTTSGNGEIVEDEELVVTATINIAVSNPSTKLNFRHEHAAFSYSIKHVLARV